jgi:hypothetical protein
MPVRAAGQELSSLVEAVPVSVDVIPGSSVVVHVVAIAVAIVRPVIRIRPIVVTIVLPFVSVRATSTIGVS